ncbi:hypothetical protein PHMEG_00028597, partial [Phytophthora megakarya]
MDMTVLGLLQHQIVVSEQILHTITKSVTTSAAANVVPPFLSRVAAYLSPAIFKTLKNEWERYAVLMSDATCRRKSNTISQWEVHCSTGKYDCHDLEWTCSCLFSRTHHLPCRHLMVLARSGHNFRFLPASTISKRWCMQTTRVFKEDLERATSSLSQFVQQSKLWLPKRVLFPEEGHEQNNARKHSATQGKQVVYVRLRRNERANRVVLSSFEKYVYAKTIVEPLLEHLSSLSSTDFYDELKMWKDKIESGLGGTSSKTPYCASDRGQDDAEDDSIALASPLYPVDELDTMELMQSMEGIEDVPVSLSSKCCKDETKSVTIGTEAVNLPTKQTNTNRDDFDDAVSDAETVILQTYASSENRENDYLYCDDDVVGNSGENGDGDNGDERQQFKNPTHEPKKEERQVDVIKMSKPPHRTNTRTTLTQKRIPSYIRYATIKYPSHLNVSVHQVTEWARLMPNLKFVKEILDAFPLIMDEAYLRGRLLSCQWKTVRPADYRYNFTIPDDLVRSLRAKFSVHEDDDQSRLSKEEKQQGLVRDMIISIDPQLKKFSRDFVYSMAGFNRVKAQTKHWINDMKWLEKNWTEVDATHVGLFAHEAGVLGLHGSDSLRRNQELATQVIPKFRTACLRSRFQLLSKRASLLFEQIVGHLGRESLLNDTVIELCLQCIADKEK